MLVVDIYGSPSSGKSTAAAFIFAKLKMHKVKCELVTEVAKDIVWDGSLKMLSNQAYVFGNQFWRLSRLEDQVDVVVMDSPLMLSTIYNSSSRLGESFNKTVVEVAKNYDCLIYYLPMLEDSMYDNVGRIHAEPQSRAISLRIVEMLKANDVRYRQLKHTEESYMSVVDDIIDELREKMPYKYGERFFR